MTPASTTRSLHLRVVLIGVDGSQLGLFAIRDAQRVADDQGLDLVEIAPNAEPPVCKVMDYGKFKYQQAMKAKAARKNQSKVEVKGNEVPTQDRRWRLRDQGRATFCRFLKEGRTR